MSTISIRCEALIGCDPDQIARDITKLGTLTETGVIVDVNRIDMEYFHGVDDTARGVSDRYWNEVRRNRDRRVENMRGRW